MSLRSDAGFMRTLLKSVYRLEDGLLVLLLLSMIILAVLQIVLRNGFDSSLLWADPALRVAVLWIGLGGAMIASRQNDHISIDVAENMCPPKIFHVGRIYSALFTAVVCGLVAYSGVFFVIEEYEYSSPAFASVPSWLCMSIIPLSFAVMSLRYSVITVLIAMNRLPVNHDQNTHIEDSSC